MGINEKIKELYASKRELLERTEFQTKTKNGTIINGGIVYDGVVDESRFAGVVFLLREATSAGAEKYGAEEWDLTGTAKSQANAQSGKYPRDWASVCYWVEAYKDCTKPFTKVENCGGNLAEVAFVNIKKTAGEGTSENAPLQAIVTNKAYCNFILEEIKSLDGAVLVICGGTFDLAKQILRTAEQPIKCEALPCGAEYFKQDDIVFLDFVHPSVRCGKELTYAYAQAAFKELKEKGLI